MSDPFEFSFSFSVGMGLEILASYHQHLRSNYRTGPSNADIDGRPLSEVAESGPVSCMALVV